jgi:hypothetical protein
VQESMLLLQHAAATAACVQLLLQHLALVVKQLRQNTAQRLLSKCHATAVLLAATHAYRHPTGWLTEQACCGRSLLLLKGMFDNCCTRHACNCRRCCFCLCHYTRCCSPGWS